MGIKGTDIIPYEYIKIVWEDIQDDEYIESDNLKGIRFILDWEYDEPITFDQVIKMAEERGYVDRVGVLTVIAESWTQGKIYTYGNYLDVDWVEQGTTKGFV